jgi:NADH:ubiquinone oxidoreductase subunit 4 (subunit M)
MLQIIAYASIAEKGFSIPGIGKHILEYAASCTRDVVWHALVSKQMRTCIRDSELVIYDKPGTQLIHPLFSGYTKYVLVIIYKLLH